MAAGDIIIPNNTVTPELLQKIATEVQKQIAAGAKEPSQYEEVKSLANLTSLPALMQTGSAYRLVRVAVEILKGLDGKDVEMQVSGGYIQWRKAGEAWNNLVSIESLKGDPFTFADFTPEQIADLKKPATDAATAATTATEAAKQATEAATTAAGKADTATTKATEATTKATEATEAAQTATAAANQAAETANTAAGRVDTAIQSATTATEAARLATQTANTAADNANKATQAATTATEAATTATTKATEATTKATEATAATQTATTAANEATNRANDAAALSEELNANPPKPVAGNWHKYNAASKQYEDTGIQAKGDPGQSFKIIGQYATLDELQAAIPDGSQAEGVYAVGAAYPYHYYAWVNVGGVWQWADQGQLQGAEGKSAFEVWQELPGNAEKTEQDYLAYLQQPATDAAKLANEATNRANTAAGNADTATTAANTAAGKADTATTAANTAAGKADTASAAANTAAGKADTATAAANEAAQAARDAAASVTTPDIDHVPTETDTTYQAGAKMHHYRPGDECRYFDPELQEYIFYKLHDITAEGKAVWQEAGSGGSARGEQVTVTFRSNQGEADAALNHATVRLSYTHWSEELSFSPGVPAVVKIPVNVEYTLTPQPLTGYKTPAPFTAVAVSGMKREIAFEWLTEKAVIRANTVEGEDFSARTLTVSRIDNGDVYYKGALGASREVLVPHGVSYVVTTDRQPGYTIPTASHQAGLATREITLNYQKIDQTYMVIDLGSRACQRITIEKPAKLNAILQRFQRALAHRSGKICYLSATNSAQFTTGKAAQLNGSKGDVVVHTPDIYYLIERMDSTHIRVGMTDTKPDEGYHHLPQSLIGAYKGRVSGGILQSASGVAPTTGLTYDELQTAARRNGNGWGLMHYWQHCLLAMMLYAKYKTHDLQTAIGTSLARWNGNNTTGSTNAIGMTDSHPLSADGKIKANYTAYNNALGVEGIFGGLYEYMQGVTLLGDRFTVTDPDGRKREIAVPEVGTGWILEMALESTGFFDLIPTKNGGSSSIAYADFCEMKSSDRIPLVVARSCFTAANPESFPDDGVAYLNATHTSYQPGNYYGGRLAYTGEIAVVQDPNEFEALFV